MEEQWIDWCEKQWKIKNITIRPALWLQENTIVMILRAKNWEYALNKDTSHPTFPAQLNPCPQRDTPPNSC